MADKCFCHLNGYKVKDADARRALEDLKSSVNENSAICEELKSSVNENSATCEELKSSVNENSATCEELTKRIYYVTPQMYGAKGDGVNDDTLPFQEAINNQNGYPVIVPIGVYCVNTLILKHHISIMGTSQERTILKGLGGTAVLYGGDYDVNATGENNPTVRGLDSCEISNLTIDGDGKAVKGIAIYGINNVLKDITVKNCTGIGVATESPGGLYSQATNLQYTMMNITSFDNGEGNIYYNGQSDSNLYNLLCYRPNAEIEGSYNLRLGKKANGSRIFGAHVWGTADYGIKNEGTRCCYTNCHAETASIAQFYTNTSTTFNGHLYLNNFSNDSCGVLMDNAGNSFIDATFSGLKTLVKLQGSCSRNFYRLLGYNGTNDDAKIFDGNPSAYDSVYGILWGKVNETINKNYSMEASSNSHKLYSDGSFGFFGKGQNVASFGVEVSGTPTNYLAVIGSNSNVIGGTLTTRGSNTDSDIAITPKGNGKVRFGTFTIQDEATINGYITIKDSSGTERKLAVLN